MIGSQVMSADTDVVIVGAGTGSVIHILGGEAAFATRLRTAGVDVKWSFEHCDVGSGGSASAAIGVSLVSSLAVE